MGTVEIRGLEVTACHGVLDFEKIKPQKFAFDIDLEADIFPAAQSDDVGDTVNYAEVCALVESIAKENSFDLIEKLACECAFAVFENFNKVTKIKIKVSKPQAPIVQQFKNVAVAFELERVKAYLSLGSSAGDREGYLNKAIGLLNKTRGVKVEKVSSFLETEPYGGVAKNKFLNCAVCVSTFLPPFVLLDEIHRIESECGRVRKKKWDDRTLDIDIIFYGDKRICDERLTVPHRDYKNREFVLKPLKSIAPHLID